MKILNFLLMSADIPERESYNRSSCENVKPLNTGRIFILLFSTQKEYMLSARVKLEQDFNVTQLLLHPKELCFLFANLGVKGDSSNKSPTPTQLGV